ncbi:hypothetical protein [Micromonospora sp. GCM10011541]|uniref:hypothetical protein n=1 Tax=Micromonospora sp. GCM10011541 TaxID=3317336 RepID=UPI003620B2FC
MPIEQISEPALVDIVGVAERPVSNGHLRITVRIEGDAANGFPPVEELDTAILEAFMAIGSVGWVGTVNKNYRSVSTLAPLPDPPTEILSL